VARVGKSEHKPYYAQLRKLLLGEKKKGYPQTRQTLTPDRGFPGKIAGGVPRRCAMASAGSLSKRVVKSRGHVRSSVAGGSSWKLVPPDREARLKGENAAGEGGRPRKSRLFESVMRLSRHSRVRVDPAVENALTGGGKTKRAKIALSKRGATGGVDRTRDWICGGGSGMCQKGRCAL